MAVVFTEIFIPGCIPWNDDLFYDYCQYTRRRRAFLALHHAVWNGFTPTDLVFPSFLFAVGNAMSFAMKRYQQWAMAQSLTKIFKRTALIFLMKAS